MTDRELLEAIAKKCRSESSYGEGFVAGVLALIDAHLAATPRQPLGEHPTVKRWQEVSSDGLPGEGHACVVLNENGDLYVAFLSAYGWRLLSSNWPRQIGTVTHWLLLPPAAGN